MTNEQRIKNLSVPCKKIDVVLDTDAFNEIDDQYAISYLLRSADKLNTTAIYAAPFLNSKSSSAGEGMEKSYNELMKILDLVGIKKETFKGSDRFMENETTPVISDAAKDLADRVKNYSPENPLYVVAIGAITNVASAILLNPQVAENTVVVWLGGHALHYHDTAEFNMKQDISAARVVIQSGVPYVQLPCVGVVSGFTLSKPEIEYWLKGKNKLTDYLATVTINEAEKRTKFKTWTRVIWDVTAVAWLLNDEDRFMKSRIITAPLPDYNNQYVENVGGYPAQYVYHINRDALMEDLINKLCQ